MIPFQDFLSIVKGNETFQWWFPRGHWLDMGEYARIETVIGFLLFLIILQLLSIVSEVWICLLFFL